MKKVAKMGIDCLQELLNTVQMMEEREKEHQ